MEEENMGTVKQIVGALVPSSASGLVKASPGIGVGGMSLAGIEIADWVSILTCLYLIVMMIGAIPKVFNTICYFRQKWVDTFSHPLMVNVIRNNAGIDAKINGAQRGKDDGKSKADGGGAES